MILGSVSIVSAAQYPDTKGTDYDEAVALLSDLGVISGYSDGTFKPGNNVKRSEFAAMVIRALGFKVTSKSPTVFEDVPADYWASGYIKYAYELGIIYGRSEKIFDPEANITNDEAIAMMVRGIGYQSKYMTGKFPTSHINMALGLGILDDIPTGSAKATRGTIAQLIFNSLGTKTVTYDAAGKVVEGDPPLKRLGGALFDGGNGDGKPFVLKGNEDSKINLKPYIGAWVTAYGNNDKKIIAISKVHSQFLKGELKGAAFGAPAAWTDLNNTADLKIGDTKVANGTVVVANAGTRSDFQNYTNGDVGAGVAPAAGTYTFAVKIEGKYVTRIYSINNWNPTAANRIDDAYGLSQDLKNAKLIGQNFEKTKNDEIDLDEFALFGVDSLDKIAEDNIVTVYVAAGNIVRVEVGTESVTGTISEKTSDNKVVINSKTYKLSGLPGNVEAATPLKAGNEGDFFLDYEGKIYDFDKSKDSSLLFAVVVDRANGSGTTFAHTMAKIKLFTEEGKTEVYDVADKCDYVRVGNVSGGALNRIIDDANDPKVNDIIQFALNDKGEVKKIEKLTLAGPYNGKITKAGTFNGKVLNGKTVLFGWDAAATPTYSLVKLENAVGQDAATVTIYENKDVAVKAALFNTNSLKSESAIYYAVNGWSTYDHTDYGYKYTMVTSEGATVSFIGDKDPDKNSAGQYAGFIKDAGTKEVIGQPGLHKVTFDSNGAMTDIVDATAAAAGPAIPGSAKKTPAVDFSATKYTKITDAGGAKILEGLQTGAVALAGDVVVYVRESGKWKLGSTNDLTGLRAGDGVTLELFDTEKPADADNVYDVVFRYK